MPRVAFPLSGQGSHGNWSHRRLGASQVKWSPPSFRATFYPQMKNPKRGGDGQLTDSKPRRSRVPKHPCFCVGGLQQLRLGRERRLYNGAPHKRTSSFSVSLHFLQLSLVLCKQVWKSSSKHRLLEAWGRKQEGEPTVH